MADFSRLINITSEDFDRLKSDMLLLEGAYFGAPFNKYKISATIDYKETISLIKTARSLNKLNIRLNKLYEDFRAFVAGSDKKEGTGATDNLSNDNKHYGDADSEKFGLYDSNDENEENNLYNDFIFGLRREIPLALSSQLDLHGKSANVNITKDLFKKIIVEILDYEKNYNNSIFTSNNLYEALKSDILSNGREVLLPYVISNVLTYLRDSNFIGYYRGLDRKNAFTILDREGLKLWANSIL